MARFTKCDKCGNDRERSMVYECDICANNVCVVCGQYHDNSDGFKQWVCNVYNDCSRYGKTTELKNLLDRQTKQIAWLVDEFAYELASNEIQIACPPDPEDIERKRLAIITDMQEIEE